MSVALRIHFTAEDLARTTVALTPDPLWEVLLSVHLLGRRDAALVFDGWRRQVRARLTPHHQPLLGIAPPWGYSPDFLTPAGVPLGLADGLDEVLSTPRRRLAIDLGRLAEERALTANARRLAEGDAAAMAQLGGAVRDYYRVGLEPYWNQIETHIHAERARLARVLLDGGVERALTTLHPTTLWQSPVLTLLDHPADRDVHLEGRGLLLVPSFFCWGTPSTLRDPELPQVVVYPVGRGLDWLGPGPRERRRSLEALIGRTRATVLVELATRPGITTTDLARRTGISLASASEHVSVLREAGLAATDREGNTVHHAVTRMGLALLDERSGS
jgi:DNA-binding transcriptional ArsR family regulator